MAQKTTAPSSLCRLAPGESRRVLTPTSPSAGVLCPVAAGHSGDDGRLKGVICADLINVQYCLQNNGAPPGYALKPAVSLE